MPLPSLEWRALETLLATVVEQPDIQLSQVAEILDEAENNSKYQNQEFKQAPPEIRQDRASTNYWHQWIVITKDKLYMITDKMNLKKSGENQSVYPNKS